MANDNLKIGGKQGFVESDAQAEVRKQFEASANKSTTEAGKVVSATELSLPKSPVVAEIDMGLAPPITPDTTPTTAGIAGLIKEFEGIQAGLTEVSKGLGEVEKDKETGLFTQMFQNLQEKIGQRPKPVSTEEKFKQEQKEAFTRFGLTPQAFAEQQNLIGQLSAFNKEVADLEAQRDMRKLQTEGQFGGRLTLALKGEQALIDRQYNSRIAAKAAQAGVVAQQLQLQRGLIQDANAMALQITNLAIHDEEQKVRDFEWTFDTYQDLFQIMDSKEREEWDRSFALAQQERDEEKDKINLLMSAYKEGINPGISIGDAKNMTLEELTSQIGPSIAGIARTGGGGFATGTPTSYKEWSLAGGKEGTGMEFKVLE